VNQPTVLLLLNDTFSAKCIAGIDTDNDTLTDTSVLSDHWIFGQVLYILIFVLQFVLICVLYCDLVLLFV